MGEPLPLIGLAAFGALLFGNQGDKLHELLLLADLDRAPSAIPARLLHLAGTAMALSRGGTLLMPRAGAEDAGESTFGVGHVSVIRSRKREEEDHGAALLLVDALASLSDWLPLPIKRPRSS